MSKSKKNEKHQTEQTEQTEHPSAARYRIAVEREAVTAKDLSDTRSSPANNQELHTAGGQLARVRLLEAEAAHERAKAELAQAALDLDGVLHGEELAQGDPDAIAVDARRAVTDIRAALDDKRRAEAAAVEATQRIGERFKIAVEAHQRLTARRLEAGLPAPARLSVGSPHDPLERRCEALEAFAERGPEVQGDKLRLYRLESEATELRALLRRRELDEQKQKEGEAEYERQSQAQAATRAKESSERNAALRAEHDRRREETEQLAREHRENERAS